MSDPVSRLNAALEGRYAIERELGEGGMATVYLADDLKHERKVALKVLKPELAAVVGAERFLAEYLATPLLSVAAVTVVMPIARDRDALQRREGGRPESGSERPE